MGNFVLRLACLSCPFVGPLTHLPRLRVSNKVYVQLVRESLERASIRILARRYKKTKKTILKIIHQITEGLSDTLAIQKQFLPLWSGILVFDGKVIRVYDALMAKIKHPSFNEDERRWIHKMRWLCGIDYATGDLPHYFLASGETRIELVMYFQTLKRLNYPLKALVCDGNEEIPRAAKFVFGDSIVIQLCTRHFIDSLSRLLPPEEEEPEARIKLQELMRLMKHVIEADALEEVWIFIKELHAYSMTFRHPIKKTFLKLFEMHKEALCAHLLHPELHLPHTSNDIENLFKQLNLRLKSLGRFFHQRYASDYLKAWALLRRFTPFTDCKGDRKYRNGKAPLTLAGCDIQNIDPFKLQN